MILITPATAFAPYIPLRAPLIISILSISAIAKCSNWAWPPVVVGLLNSTPLTSTKVLSVSNPLKKNDVCCPIPPDWLTVIPAILFKAWATVV